MVLTDLVLRWETAYRRYVEASRVSTVVRDQDTAREMLSASQQVAAAWRALESTSDLPWWTAAALRTAAEAFEAQAREWKNRAQHAFPMDNGRPQQRLSVQPQPWPRHRGEQR